MWHAGKDLNPQPSALEAPVLPIELPTYKLWLLIIVFFVCMKKMAEAVGFEPTSRLRDDALAVHSFNPLGHASMFATMCLVPPT